MQKLSKEFYRQNALDAAQGLIGCLLISEIGGRRCGGIIVETEAYLGAADPACHSYGGRRTARNEVMYRSGGLAYVYQIYGIHYCFNVVCSAESDPQAVLVRALRPTAGIDIMHERRSAVKYERLCAGPGNLCKALAITRESNGADLSGELLYILNRESRPQIVAAPRINVDYAGEAAGYPWRFCKADSRFVSVKPGTTKRRTNEST